MGKFLRFMIRIELPVCFSRNRKMKYPYCSGAQHAILKCLHTKECIERRGCPKLKGSEGIGRRHSFLIATTLFKGKVTKFLKKITRSNSEGFVIFCYRGLN